MGYHRAGFEVVGVDIHPQPNYPFEFHQADALDFLRDHGRKFDARHASPPCQAYSITHHSHGRTHPDLIGPVRSLLLRIGGPWVIENVPGAPLLDPVTLCWSMFHTPDADDDGTPLRMERHRLFESSIPLPQPEHPRHDRAVKCAGAYGGGRSQRKDGRGGYTPSMDARRRLMGMPWASGAEVGQAIPPAYAEWVGLHLRAHLMSTEAAA